MKNTIQLIAAAKMSKVKYLTTCQVLFILSYKVKFSVKKYSRLPKRTLKKNIAAKENFYECYWEKNWVIFLLIFCTRYMAIK